MMMKPARWWRKWLPAWLRVLITRVSGHCARTGADRLEVQAFEALPGHGVQGQANGQAYVLGNHRLIEAQRPMQFLFGIGVGRPSTGRPDCDRAGLRRGVGRVCCGHTLRPEARDAVAALHLKGIQTVLLSGDNDRVAQGVAQQAGMQQAHGQLLPQDKLTKLEALRQAHGPVAMVGDGINDAPALAQNRHRHRHGCGRNRYRHKAADVVVMNDDLRRIQS